MDILSIVLAIALIVYIYTAVTYHYVVDGFSDLYPVNNEICNMPLTTEARASGPADVSDPRTPYNLLGDYLKPALAEGETPRTANLTSECAYIADAQRLIEKTGSYGQITNNYKRAKPDNVIRVDLD